MFQVSLFLGPPVPSFSQVPKEISDQGHFSPAMIAVIVWQPPYHSHSQLGMAGSGTHFYVLKYLFYVSAVLTWFFVFRNQENSQETASLVLATHLLVTINEGSHSAKLAFCSVHKFIFKWVSCSE